jgi:uncharacterized membrane-anchored protein
MVATEDMRWFAVYEFDRTGYIKDDEKNSLDSDAMLKSMQQREVRANEERRKRGFGTLEVIGWIKAPYYANDTHNLEWATKCKDDKGQFVANHNTRYLGRHGVMTVTLVDSPENLTATMPEFQKVMSGYTYTAENSYQAFKEGDKVAEYGLSALVVGGVAAAAAKSGFFKSFWKLIVAGLVTAAGAIRSLFNKKPAETDINTAETNDRPA